MLLSGSRARQAILLAGGCALGALSAALACGLPGNDSFGLVALLVGLAVVLSIARCERGVAPALLVGFGVRVALTLCHRYISPLPDSDGDALWYQQLGAEWATHGIGYVVGQFRPGAYLYVWLNAVFYALLGESPLLVQAVNVLFGSLIVWNVYRLALALGDGRDAARAAWMAALFPSLMLYSCIIMREVAVAYPLLLATLYAVRWAVGERLQDMLWCLLCLLVSAGFHTGAVAGLAAVGLLAVVRWDSAVLARKHSGLARQTLGLAAAAAAIGLVVATGWGLSKLESLSSGFSMAGFSEYLGVASRGRTAYLGGAVIRSPVDALWQLPLRLVYFLFAPFVWSNLGLQDLPGVVDALLYAGLAALILRSARSRPLGRSALVVVLMFLAVSCMFAMGTSNYGTGLRHRSKVAPLIIVVAAVALGEKHKPIARGGCDDGLA